MTKRKLERFAEMVHFKNVLQPEFKEVFAGKHPIKGKWRDTFFGNGNPVVIELGCGKGEYTTGLARKFPGKNFIGIDIKGSRMWKGARTALEENLKNTGFLRTRIEFIGSFFDEDEVDEIWITFPDPQPKKSRKRLLSCRFLNMYKCLLKPEGFVHLKTDSEMLYYYTLNIAKHNNFFIDRSTEDLYRSDLLNDELTIKTFYEKGFLEKGCNICYLKMKLPASGLILDPPEYE